MPITTILKEEKREVLRKRKNIESDLNNGYDVKRHQCTIFPKNE